MTAIFDPDHEVAVALRAALRTRPPAVPVTTAEALSAFLQNHPDTSTVVVGPSVRANAALDLANSVRAGHPDLSLVLVRDAVDDSMRGRAVRSGVADVVQLGDVSALNRAVRDCLHEPAGTGQIVTVFSTKGGSGKTTLATNLATVLADHGRHRTALVDLDFVHGDLMSTMRIEPRATLADAAGLRGRLQPEDLAGLLTPCAPGLSALVAPAAPAAARRVTPMLVAETLHVLRRQVDQVVVDTPAGLDDQVLAALDLSDLVVLIATLDVPSLRNLAATMQILRTLEYPQDRWRVVLNRADSPVGLTMQDAQEILGAPIAAGLPSSADVPASVNRGAPLAAVDPDHPFSAAVHAFAVQHLGATWLTRPAQPAHANGGQGAPNGRFSWLFGRRK